MRSSGILLHISSLPSPYGIGTMGKAAYEFADFLHAAGQHYWQILPIGPTSFGDSPYQSFSTHAGNPYFIDLDMLVEQGLLTKEEVDEIPWDSCGKRVDYGFLFRHRFPLLRKAYARGWERDREQVDKFRWENHWLPNYALYMALKSRYDMQSWDHWPEELRMRNPEALWKAEQEEADTIHFYEYLQFVFFRQWNALRDYVHSLGMEIIGDLPIYVPYDSCDVWANPLLFQIDPTGTPVAVAGCPPDSFSATGQLWGNPLYNWWKMGETGYAWWHDRIAGAGKLFDVIRIDHFRGLESYWSVPYGDTDARNGHWEPGPSHHFIQDLRWHFPNLKLIAEDLGYLTEEVRNLQRTSGYPGMKVLEFAFDPREPGNYLPHRYEFNCVCYTGTHDNETLVQFLQEAPEDVRANTADYLGLKPDDDLTDGVIRLGMSSTADTFIAQMQDYLQLGAEARMNRPGTLSTANWSWRMENGAATPALAEKIRKMTRLYERIC